MHTVRRFLAPVLGLMILSLGLAGYLFVHRDRILKLDFLPHAPDWRLLMTATPVIQLHVVAAMAALAIGTVLLIGVKGTQFHRMLGWTWASSTASATAVSSLFIRAINPGAFSLIHLLSGWTIVALPMAVYAARRHRVAAHRRAMTGMFVGGLILAGLFAFLPGRLMWAVFFG